MTIVDTLARARATPEQPLPFAELGLTAEEVLQGMATPAPLRSATTSPE